MAEYFSPIIVLGHMLCIVYLFLHIIILTIETTISKQLTVINSNQQI